MATRRLQVHPGEARTIAAYLDERAALLKMLTGAVTLVCAREGIANASLSGVDGNELVLEVPDDQTGKHPQDGGVALFSADTPATDAGVVGAIGTGPNAETPPESTPDGKNGHSKPVVDAPDAGTPAVTAPAPTGAIPSRGEFRHTEGG